MHEGQLHERYYCNLLYACTVYVATNDTKVVTQAGENMTEDAQGIAAREVLL